MVVACLMLAHQVAAKSARDALFLSEFSVARLPAMVIAAAAVAIFSGLLNSRLLQWLGPTRVVPWSFAVSGGLHIGEWFFWHSKYRSIVVVIIYLHVVALGSVVLSGFWSMLNERFDPHSGKKYFGRIAGVGTVGGILGGIAAERFAVWLPPTAVLLLLAGLHLLCGGISLAAVHHYHPAVSPGRTSPDSQFTSAAWRVFQRSSYLQMIALIVILGTTTAGLLDIVFKTNAATLIGKGPHLFRFFAIFYTVGQALSLAVQFLVTRKWLEKLGLALGVSSLPAGVVTAGVGALLVPTFPMLVAARGLEVVLRGSIYRAAYELLYTPLPVQEKRAAKPVVDVVFDRVGDALGGALSQLLLITAGVFALKGMLLVSVGLAVVALLIGRRLGGSYVRVLENGLVERAVELDVATSKELITRSVLLRTLVLKKEPSSTTEPVTPAEPIIVHQSQSLDPVLGELADLRSGNTERVRHTLTTMDRLDPLIAPQLIVLLAWDEIAPDAIKLLRKYPGQITGQLVDSLLDEQVDFAIRRRVPRALAYSDDARAVSGLMRGLDDSRFEVRFQAARALDVILQRNPQYRPEQQAIFAVIERELSVGRNVWENRRLLDQRQSTDEFSFLDNILREHAQLSWEYVFSLLALIFPREPLKIAFQALHTDDRLLRGLALEYLDSVLPQSLRNMPRILESVATIVPSPDSTDVATRLIEASESVTLKLTNRPSPDAGKERT